MSQHTFSDIRIGISGWRYAPWRGKFYPKNLGQKNELHFASRTVNSIEINGSFYALQTPERYTTWYADVPHDFVFSIKAPRFITHIHRLNNVEEPIANFFASGVLQLKEKLGPILWQFPPSFTFDKNQFKHFLSLLPMTFGEAQQCALQHGNDLKNPDTQMTLPIKTPLRHAVEIRNESFNNQEFVELMRDHNAAIVIADTAGKWPQIEDITSDFIYMRLHGDTALYQSGYSETALNRWHERIQTWSEGKQPVDAKLLSSKLPTEKTVRDVYCYFDNTEKMWAPYDARYILEKFNLDKNLEEKPGKLRKQA